MLSFAMTSGLASDFDKFGRRTLRLSLALLSVVGAIGRAGLRKEVGLLRPGPRGPKVLRTKWYSDVLGARSTRDGDTGNEDNSSFARFFKLDKYAMLSFAMTSGLASDFDKFEIIITLTNMPC